MHGIPIGSKPVGEQLLLSAFINPTCVSCSSVPPLRSFLMDPYGDEANVAVISEHFCIPLLRVPGHRLPCRFSTIIIMGEFCNFVCNFLQKINPKGAIVKKN